MIDLGKKQQWIFRTIRHHNMDIFTIPTPPFNVQIRIQKKLLDIMRFSEGLKIEILGTLCRYFARFLAIWASSHKPTACFIKNDPSFVLFQGRFFKLSPTKFLFPPTKFLFRPRKSGKVWEFVQDLWDEWFWTLVEDILFFLVYSKFRPKSALHFNTQPHVFWLIIHFTRWWAHDLPVEEETMDKNALHRNNDKPSVSNQIKSVQDLMTD